MFITPLDFTNVRINLAKLNGIKQRPQVTNLLRIYSERYTRGEKLRDVQRSANILQSIMDTNIEKNMPLYSNIENYFSEKMKIKLNDTKTISETLSWMYDSITRNELTEYISIDGNKLLNVITTDESSTDFITMSAYDVIKLGKKYRNMSNLKQFEWVNVCGNNIFKGDLIVEEALMLKTLNAYSCGIPGVKSLFQNFRLTNFVSNLGISKTNISVEYNYIKLTATYNLDASKSELPTSLANRLNGTKIVMVTAVGVDNKLILDNKALHLSYTDIVCVDTCGMSTDSWKPRFCISNSFYEGEFNKIESVPWPDENLFSIFDMVRSTVLRVDHVWIAAGKGIGKSRLSSIIDKKFLIIDSDVKGKFLYTVSTNSEMQSLLKTDPLNTKVLALFMLCVSDTKDTIPSVYEILADQYCSENNITLDIIMSKSITHHFHNFVQLYNKASKPLSSDKNIFFKLSGTMLSFCNLINRDDPNEPKYTKVIQFVHNANELYGAMSDAIYNIEPVINTIPIHLRRTRRSHPVVQCFLSEFYIYADTFTATPVTLNLIHSVMVAIENSGRIENERVF